MTTVMEFSTWKEFEEKNIPYFLSQVDCFAIGYRSPGFFSTGVEDGHLFHVFAKNGAEIKFKIYDSSVGDIGKRALTAMNRGGMQSYVHTCDYTNEDGPLGTVMYKINFFKEDVSHVYVSADFSELAYVFKNGAEFGSIVGEFDYGKINEMAEKIGLGYSFRGHFFNSEFKSRWCIWFKKESVTAVHKMGSSHNIQFEKNAFVTADSVIPRLLGDKIQQPKTNRMNSFGIA